MRAIFKGLLAETQPRFMHERGRLERVAGLLARHFRARDHAQFRVHRGHQLVGRVHFAFADRVQDARHLVR